MKLLFKIYFVYGLVTFGLIFLILFPFFLLPIFIKPLEKMAAPLNRIWAKLFFFFLFLNRSSVTFEEPLSRNQRYIFCANHFSYLDVPTVGLINHNFKFIGKSSLKKIPIWGYMYSKLHILINRESLRDRYQGWEKAKEAIQKGFSIVFFPEGAMIGNNAPEMSRFKEGSFRLATTLQVPIVPLTIPFNHIILPSNIPFVLRGGTFEIKVHRPIWPEGDDDQAMKLLKQKVRYVIEKELERTNKK